ncbi:hypothetical protein B0I35DRAFT_476603 [Stachybotrys elegans]|uniref:Zn(2)-C6 fungal-type domain-containing protein n=1 Tax=Stachybotrys elegans TaxID=80388 RepID=A0A8K0SZS1_9HYPO|nr:hypothetical protein B0I35DRAFT_476603 [Stachybotrys elegans]
MFITLKASKDGARLPSMKQVAHSNASIESSRSHFGAGRKDACAICRTKKIRCTGDELACDRCKAQKITCVPSRPANQRKARKQRQSASQRISKTQINESGPTQQPTPSSPHGFIENVAPDEPVPPCFILDSCWNQRINYDLSSGDQISQLLTTPTRFPGAVFNDESAELPFDMGDFDPAVAYPWEDDASASNNTQLSSGPDAASSSASETANASKASEPCTCLPDILDVVQKLEDDEFRLRTLAFDHVLKLQKWLLFHCCKQLDCSKCSDKATAPAMILIICERISEMFRCLARRMPTLSPHGIQPPAADARLLPPPQGSTSPLEEATGGKLFDGGTAEDGSATPCSLDMFSPDFRAEYSFEEQLHMIHVLTKIQVRNFNQFLVRLGHTPQSQRSRARQGKICFLIRQLQESASAIDASFCSMLQNHFENPDVPPPVTL